MDGDVATTRGLLDDGVDPNSKVSGYPILALACDCRHRLSSQIESGDWAAVAALLIERGADVHARNPLGHQPIHLAARDSTADTVRVLMRAGADLAAIDGSDKLPIEVAIKAGSLEIVQTLLDAGAALPRHVETEDYWMAMQHGCSPAGAVKVAAAERIVRAALLARGLEEAMGTEKSESAHQRLNGPFPL